MTELPGWTLHCRHGRDQYMGWYQHLSEAKLALLSHMSYCLWPQFCDEDFIEWKELKGRKYEARLKRNGQKLIHFVEPSMLWIRA